MQAFLLRLSIFDRLLFVIIALFTLVLCLDLYDAIGAQACSIQVYSGCYPWGAEGPAASNWFYETKERYLFQGFIHVVFLIAAMGILVLYKKNTKKTATAIMLVVVPFLITWLLNLFLIS